MKQVFLGSIFFASLLSCNVLDKATANSAILEKGISKIQRKELSEIIKADSVKFRGRSVVFEHNYPSKKIDAYFDQVWEKYDNILISTYHDGEKEPQGTAQAIFERTENKLFSVFNKVGDNRVFILIYPTETDSINSGTNLDFVLKNVFPSASSSTLIKRVWLVNGKVEEISEGYISELK